MRNVALDLGKKITLSEVLEGEVIRRRTGRKLSDFDDLIGAGTPPARIAFEACLEARHVYKKLQLAGHVPVLVDTTRVRQLGVGHHKRKTDQLDAEVLAKALEANRIPRAHLLSDGAAELRRLVGVRRSLVGCRAELATTLKALGRQVGTDFGKAKPNRLPAAVAKVQDVPPDLLALISPMLRVIDELNIQIDAVDKQLEQAAAKTHVVRQLSTAKGVSTVVAAAFISVIDDPHRFSSAHHVQAYVGLVPAENSSSDKRAIGHITKQGNSYLRALLVQAAWSVLRSRGNDPLKLWAEQVRARRGARVAVVALARKLAGVLWAMWRDGRDYNPLRLRADGPAELTQRVANKIWAKREPSTAPNS